MPFSMTGFARLSRQFENGELIWELRSVNHRFLELSLRIPEELRAAEPQFRAKIQKMLKRGRIDGTLKFNRRLLDNESLQLDEALISSWLMLAVRFRLFHRR